MKTLILENITDSEQRFNDYVIEVPGEKFLLNKLGTRTEEEIIKAFCDPKLTGLMFESTLSDRKQFLRLLILLVNLKDKIVFRGISVLYTYKSFETFLNVLVRKEPEFNQLLKELFETYQIFGIEYQEFEDRNPEVQGEITQYSSKKPQFFKKLIYHYDTVQIKRTEFNDGTPIFSYIQPVVIDPRKEFRERKLISFSKDILESSALQDFLEETEAYLKYQEEIIEERKDKDYEELIKSNKNHQLILGLLKVTFELA